MANLNSVFLIGRVVRDPELRYTPKGTAVVDLGLAVNRVWNDEAGQKREETTWVDVILWSRQAEIAQKYLVKGRSVFIEGRLQTDTWDDKQTGQKRSRLRVVGENLQLLGTKPTTSVAPSPPSRSPILPRESVQQPRPPAPAIDPDFDNIPSDGQ